MLDDENRDRVEFSDIVGMANSRAMGCWFAGVACLALSVGCLADSPGAPPVDTQVRTLIDDLAPALRARVVFGFEDEERYRFRWTPGRRKGVRISELDTDQRQAFGTIMRTVLSEAGARKVDAILATEAALGVIENAPENRDPGKYWLAVFGEPGPGVWGMRFEGHHLSANFTLGGAAVLSATPLFLGANPEHVPSGPDMGLRALAAEVDLGWALYQSLDDAEREAARRSEEWFGRFLTSAGKRHADLGKPAGIRVAALQPDRQLNVRRLIAAYVETVNSRYATPYLERVLEEELPHLRFHWRGADAPGDGYYYRIAGRRLLIEHDNRAGGTHVHSVWRDLEHDFGGR